MANLADHLSTWLHDQVTSGGGHGVVFGLSGGVDSAVVAGLAARAFPERALAVLMPCHSDPQDAQDARDVARHFKLDFVTVDLAATYDHLVAALTAASPFLLEHDAALNNIKPRLRMTTLYALANERNYFVAGSSNRSELTVGYFTKYGDGGVDLLPLGNLVKHEVWDLARVLGVPQRIIERTPTAGLRPGQTDEEDLGLTYKELDTFLITGLASERVRSRVDALKAGCAHKHSLPPIAPRPGR